MTQNECNPHFPKLFSPMRIGKLEVKNRFVVPAVTTNFAEPNGDVGDRLINYLAARAQGGFGLIVTENLGVHESGRVMPRMGMADTDERIPHLARLAQAVKSTVRFSWDRSVTQAVRRAARSRANRCSRRRHSPAR